MFQFPQNRWTDLANQVGSRFATRAASHDETDAFVAENYAKLTAHKILAAGVPEELGGGGAGVAELAGMLRTLASLQLNRIEAGNDGPASGCARQIHRPLRHPRHSGERAVVFSFSIRCP